MSVFCCKCGSFDLVHMKGYNKCSFCGNSINDRKYKNFKNKKIFAFKNDKTKSLKEYTKQNLNEKIYPFLKTKDSKHLVFYCRSNFKTELVPLPNKTKPLPFPLPK